jgi:hypothetical protein
MCWFAQVNYAQVNLYISRTFLAEYFPASRLVANFDSREATTACSLGRKPKGFESRSPNSREEATAVDSSRQLIKSLPPLRANGILSLLSLGLRPRLDAVTTSWLEMRFFNS